MYDGWKLKIINVNSKIKNIKSIDKLNPDLSLNINLAGDFIYYTNESDNNKIYKIKTDGTFDQSLNKTGS